MQAATRARDQVVRRRGACSTTCRSTCREGCGFVILGRSGTGKSVTLRHIIGLVRPDAGRVFVHGEEISGAARARRWPRCGKQIGFLFQSAALFDSISVGENVAFPMRRHTQLPDAEIRERAPAQARGGRPRQATTTRCPAISRAACASAPAWRGRWRSTRAVLLVDEPSAGLDPITSEEIDELLLGLKQDGRRR